MPIDMSLPPEEAALNEFKKPRKSIEVIAHPKLKLVNIIELKKYFEKIEIKKELSKIFNSKPKYKLYFISSSKLNKDTSLELELIGSNMLKYGRLYFHGFNFDKNNNKYIFRFNYIPLNYKNTGIGVVVQYIDSSNRPSVYDTGIMIKLFEKIFNKPQVLGVRYFPESKTFNGFASINYKNINLLNLIKYVPKQKAFFMRNETTYNLKKVGAGFRIPIKFNKKDLRNSINEMELFIRYKF